MTDLWPRFSASGPDRCLQTRRRCNVSDPQFLPSESLRRRCGRCIARKAPGVQIVAVVDVLDAKATPVNGFDAALPTDNNFRLITAAIPDC
ncbi:hypothetical protein K8O61_10305 [Xanthomonas cerealis pv. cerealis]|uniref:hypothetical protein n=1 Tax=Xanthomonas cerealis TaxID=3390025 RepID=UPI001F15BB51|nr:hypothetical protein [Xanthomonas translucens]UKE67935.1 hypothetical protein K8O61_10305 [Xanthomonas translucens pv. pistacia]